MAKAATIAVRVRQGEGWTTAYVHNSGGLLEVLRAHYATPESASALLSCGNASFITERMDAPPYHSFNRPVEGCSVFYGRDRGERHQGPRYSRDLTDHWIQPKVYAYENGEWSRYDS